MNQLDHQNVEKKAAAESLRRFAVKKKKRFLAFLEFLSLEDLASILYIFPLRLHDR
jgi:hypothetical protein